MSPSTPTSQSLNLRPFSTALVIAAAGSGSRMSAPDAPIKQWRLLSGQPLLVHAFHFFDNMESIGQIAIALDAESLQRSERTDALRSETGKTVRLIPGAATRQESVWAALQSLDPKPEIILIHDAARPFPPHEEVQRSISEARRAGGAILAHPIVETLKRVDEKMQIAETIDRSRLWAAQTPQTFQYAPLIEAYRAAASDRGRYTDDASIFEAHGGTVKIIESPASNFKVTTTGDLERAERRLARSQKKKETSPMRIGHGYDLHVFSQGRPLILGGVKIPYTKGLQGHSDADVLTHAICDAILGAAGLRDIGYHFPDDDPQYEGASSLDLLKRVLEMAAAKDLHVENIDVSVIAEKPKLQPHIEEIHNTLGAILSPGKGAGAINIKATTNEGVDSLGRGEGIAAHAVALLRHS